MDTTDDLYKAHDKRSGPKADIDRSKLHPHPHGMEEDRDSDARSAERRALHQAIQDKVAAARNPPPPPPAAPPPKDENHRKPEARNAFVSMQVWVNSMVQYIDVKTTS